MIRDYSPILVGKVAPAPTHIPAPAPTEKLEPPRALPCYDGMDDTGLYAEALLQRRITTLERALTQLSFMARTSGTPTPELLRACEGAEALIGKTMEANHG